jgi:alkylated DNA repair protein (DNA oxidative demethylase)
MTDLFAAFEAVAPTLERLCDGAMVLRGFAAHDAPDLLKEVAGVVRRAPLRHMVTPGGFRMSVGMTNCGALGWISERHGYRYDAKDPDSGKSWPAMPPTSARLARAAAERAGYAGFVPDACLINRYDPGTRLTLHQDKNERDYSHPIVSVSLGLPAMFQFGGTQRSDRTLRLPLTHGDVVVWGGPARMRYHGVLPLKYGTHPATGACRINLTFRRAG